MLTPVPGTDSREYGILRTFANKEERESFYASPMFKAWEQRARALTEGEPEYRELHGLEAWFRTPNLPPPPRWKMAVATFAGVYPTVMVLSLTLGPLAGQLPFLFRHAVLNLCVVMMLTWLVMPFLTRILRNWLHPHK